MSDKIVNCIICESDKIETIRIGSYKLTKCLNCGIVFNFKLPSQEEHNNYYENDYRITSSIRQIDIEQRRISRIPEQIILISEILNFNTKQASLLDIGCDKGFFLDEIRRYGFSVFGFEPSEISRKYCTNIGLTIYRDFNDIKRKFDVITLWHSLEHHINPLVSLSNLKNYLNDDGFIFIRVPDFDCIWRKIFKSKWVWLQPENHYFHFTINSLSFLLNKSGFDILTIQHRKPNNKYTSKSNRLTNILFKSSFQNKLNIKKSISRLYEDVTGLEIFAVAKPRGGLINN